MEENSLPAWFFTLHPSSSGSLVCMTVHGRNMSKLSIWILEDYGTSKWTLKHTVSILKVFAKTNIEFCCYYIVNEYYSTFHPQWNLLLFVGVGAENDIVAHNMNSRKSSCHSYML